MCVSCSFDKTDGVYEVVYQDMADEDEEDDDDEDDDEDDNDIGDREAKTEVLDAKRGEQFVRLSELDWHIFVELDGMSEDQIEREVFSIPKRRVTESHEPSPKSIETATTESFKSSREPSPSSFGSSLVTGRTISNAPALVDRTNARGERIDADGNVITTKLLIKGVSTKCDAATLRRLFVSDVRRIRVGSDAPRSLVTDLDLFFFDDSGWALVEFRDADDAAVFQRKLNNRPLYGKSLRIYFASRKEVETFQHAKRNFALRRRQAEAKRAAALDAPVSSNHAAHAEPVKATAPYCLGRKLHWHVSVEEMEDSPSRRLGISPALEQQLRTKCVKVIQRLGKKLHLDREDATSAIVALNRFFTFHAMNVRNVEFLAAATLHVFLKAHGRRFSWLAFVSEVYAAKNTSGNAMGATPQLTKDSDEYKATMRQLVSVEKELLEGLRYDVSSADPYALLDALIGEKTSRASAPPVPVPASAPVVVDTVDNDAALALSPSLVLQQDQDQEQEQEKEQPPPDDHVLPPHDVQREARQLMSEVLRLPIWVQTPVECIVLSIVYVSAAVTQALSERSSSSSSSAFDALVLVPVPAYLPVLDSHRNELESLMLLECALSLCESLKDRWVRLEKIAKASRKTSRSDSDFDTEAFAVARIKPVEMSERIAQLLKAWVNVSSPPPPLPPPPSSSLSVYGPSSSSRGASVSPDRDVSSRPPPRDYITLSMVGQSLAGARATTRNVAASSRSARRSDESATEATVLASAVVPKQVAKGPGGGSTSVLSSADRLHASEVLDVDMIRKRGYLGTVSAAFPFDLAGAKVYLQSWPSRDSSPTFFSDGTITESCVRELAVALALHSKCPSGFVKLHGIVFPDEKKPLAAESTATSKQSTETALGLDFADVTSLAVTSATSSSAASASHLDAAKHYLAFEQPLHLYSGFFDAKVTVPLAHKKRAIYDMLSSLAACHDLHYVHRSVVLSHCTSIHPCVSCAQRAARGYRLTLLFRLLTL